MTHTSNLPSHTCNNYHFGNRDAWRQCCVHAARTDGYMSGTCQRCFRIRTECQKVIDSGKRCTEKN
jgi:hypothetical protein